MVPIFLLLTACIEHVTGEAVPLDPRFYEGADNGNAANEGGAGAADGAWLDWKGERVKVALSFSSPETLPLQVDVAEPDANVEGGLRRAGSFHLNGPEALVIEVPQGVKKVHVEAFQDVTGDGPTGDDPFAELDVDMAIAPVGETVVVLVVGGRKQAGGGDGGGGGGGGTDGAWLAFTGDRTSVVFSVTSDDADHAIQVDVSEPDASSPGGLKSAGRIHLAAPGSFPLEVPENVQSVRVEAFQDLAGDGPTADDPFAAVSLDMSALPSGPIPMKLVAGARGGDGAAGAGGGGAAPGAAGGPTLVFPEGPKVKVSGKVTTPREIAVKIDLFKLNPETPAGRDYLFKIDAEGDGSFVFEVPAAYGSLELEAYQDIAGDGPSGDDPKGRAGPIPVGAANVSGVAIAIP